MKRLAFVSFAMLVALAGCSGDKLGTVSGTVKVDDELLADGEIIFVAADNNKSPAAGPIKEGKYSVQVLPGPKKVQIKASRPTPKPDPVMGTAAREAMLGPEYNEQTTLTAEIKSGDNPGVDFNVKALPIRK